jgi:hypothetical protein
MIGNLKEEENEDCDFVPRDTKETVDFQVNNLLQIVYNVKALMREVQNGAMSEEQARPIIFSAMSGIENMAFEIKDHINLKTTLIE